jgi:hypothetical protein
MQVPQYHIFSGFRDKNPMWLETVEGLATAHKRLQERATEEPGPYFIFCSETHAVVASLDTGGGEQGRKLGLRFLRQQP